MQTAGFMRASVVILSAVSLFCTSAFASEATVNAALGRKPVSPVLFTSLGDEATQAQLAASRGIELPGELGKVALFGTLANESFGGVFNEGGAAPMQGAAVDLYTDYDGAGRGFGNTLVKGTSSNPTLSVFAAYDFDANVTVVLVNASPTAPDAVTVGFKGIGQKGDWRAFELKADGTIAPAGSGTIYEAVLTRTVQPYSALLIEYRPVGGILPVWEAPKEDVVVPAAGVVESDAAAQPLGCSATGGEVGVLALFAMLAVSRSLLTPARL